MKVFTLKQGDTKTLTARLTRRGVGISVTPLSVKLVIYQASGSLIERSMTMGSDASTWTYKFTAADQTALGAFLDQGGRPLVEFPCEVVVVWSAGDQETGPTEGTNVIRLTRALPRAS